MSLRTRTARRGVNKLKDIAPNDEVGKVLVQIVDDVDVDDTILSEVATGSVFLRNLNTHLIYDMVLEVGPKEESAIRRKGSVYCRFKGLSAEDVRFYADFGNIDKEVRGVYIAKANGNLNGRTQ